jgi:hypothetical protein
VERDWDDAVEVCKRIDDLASDESLEPPLTLIRYPMHIGLKMSHGVGDGRQFLTVIAAAFHTATSGEVVRWPVEPAGPFPLATAALRTFGKQPGLVRRAVRDRPSDYGLQATPLTVRPWTPSRRSNQTMLPRDKTDEVIAWAKEFAPGATRFAIQVTLVLRALNRVGFAVSPIVGVIVDLRRYLGWRYIDGNFVAGVPMSLNWEMAAEQISSRIKATNASGRPLAGHILACVRGGVMMPAPTSVDVDGLLRVTFTNLGRSPEIESLPFQPGAPTVYAGSVPPEGPLGITVMTGEISGLMDFGTTFHDNVVDPVLFADAMSTMVSDPIGLLSKPRTTS